MLRLALAAALVFPTLAAAQPPPNVQTLLDTALEAPPELAADVILQLAERDVITDPTRKSELLGIAAQELAPDAAHKFPLQIAALQPTDSESDIGILVSMASLRTDQLSLQVRALHAELAIDPRRARETFTQLALPSIPTFACEDSLVVKPDAYYELAEEIAKQSFTFAERNSGEQAAYVAGLIENVSSPLELAPAGNLIAGILWANEELDQLAALYSAKLAEMPASDPRSSATTLGHLQRVLPDLAQDMRRARLSSLELIEAYRAWVVRVASSPRCADTAPGTPGDRSIRSAADLVTRLAANDLADAVTPIADTELVPSEVRGGATIHRFWDSPEHQALATSLVQLRFGDQRPPPDEGPVFVPEDVHVIGPLPVDQRRSPEWQQQVEDFLSTLDYWEQQFTGDPLQLFHMKSLFYLDLVELAPEGPLRTRILETIAAFIAQSPVYETDPAEWYYELQRLLRTPGREEALDAEIRESIRRSGNPTMTLYADLDEILSAR